MGLIGKEIIQSRVWVEANTTTPPPNLNYKLTFPITVFDAVRKDKDDEESPTLTRMLEIIFAELKSKQPIIAGKPANNLMTFAGAPGAVGAIKITQDIPWNPADQIHDRIPTEKAIGDLLMKVGLVNADGSINKPGEGGRVRWSDIVGRPNIYTGLGSGEDGFITQRGVTDAINHVDSQLIEHEATVAVKFDTILKRIDTHTTAVNPHNISAEQIGAVSKALFDFHIDQSINPHNITPVLIGLGKVQNTTDAEKPISIATQAAIDAINDLLEHMTDDVGGLKFIVNIQYNQSNGVLTWIYNDGSKLTLSIPIDGLVDEITYDEITKELVINELGGVEKRISIKDLFIRYVGSSGTNILVEIEGDQGTGNQIIKANIVAKSITENEMADDSITNRSIKDQSISNGKIKDLTITTVKYVDQSITTEKIAELAITNSRLDSRSVTGRVLFTSPDANKILAVRAAGSDPVWTQIVADMISLNAVQTKHIQNGAVTSDKLGDQSVINARIGDLAVTNNKLSINAVTNDKITNNTIAGNKLVSNPTFDGLPKITARPTAESNTNELPDTRWVRDFVRDTTITHENLGDRVVDGSNLFTSSIKDRVLIVPKANVDPVWGLINHGMMDVNTINTDNIIDLSVTGSKIHDGSISTRHMTNKAVQTDHIADNAVTTNKLFKSDSANRVLASLINNGSPVYTQVNRAMIEFNAIGTMQIEDRCVTLAKLQTSENSQRVLAVGLRNTEPVWMQVTNKMIADKSVDGRTLFSSPGSDMLLGVTTSGIDPAWLKVNSKMLQDRIIDKRHIALGAIYSEHLQEKIIEAKHLAGRIIQSGNIESRSITGVELFTSPLPNRVLGIDDKSYANAQWMQIKSDMIEDTAITKEKIFQSTHPYRVLAATQAGVPPEYTLLTGQFLVDDTITPNKLQHNFVFHGTPEITIPPVETANNFQVPSTSWVRKTIAAIMKDFNPEILFDTIDSSMIKPGSITGSKLFTHPYGPRVLGITGPNEEVEFILIEESLIVNGAVTSNKIQRNLQLYGSPDIEVRPSPKASDAVGGGTLIPDCQWVLDRIKEFGGGGTPGNPGGGTSGSIFLGPIPADRVDGVVSENISPKESGTLLFGDKDNPSSLGPIGVDRLMAIMDGLITPDGSGSTTIGNGTLDSVDPKRIAGIIDGNIQPNESDSSIIDFGTGGGSELLPNSILTEHIMNRAVTAPKLFTTEFSNRVLAVIDPNTDPQYVKVTQDMLVNSRIIDANRLFTSTKNNVLLGVKSSSIGPEYTKINHDMLEEKIIDTVQLVDRCVTGDKLSNACITADKLSGIALIRNYHIFDSAITTEKIATHAVENDKIADQSIDTRTLVPDLELPAHTTVAAHTDYERRAIRNTILSPNSPRGGYDGDIFFQYI